MSKSHNMSTSSQYDNTTAGTNNSSNNSSDTKMSIFHRFDPTLRLLLTCNDHLKNHNDCNKNKNNANNNDDDNQNILSLYKTQITLFETLKDSLLSACSCSTDCTDIIRIQALQEMEEYITLPIIISLQQYCKHTIVHTTSSNINVILTSSQRKVIQHASSCLTTYTRIIHQHDCHKNYINKTAVNDNKINCTNNDDTSMDCMETIITSKIRLKCIVALSMTLTTILQQQQQQYQDQCTYNNNLDKGEDCIQALLECLNTLLLPPKQMSSSQSSKENKQTEFITKFLNYIPNGGLIHGMVQNCLQCIDHHNYINNHEKKYNTDGISTNNNKHINSEDKNKKKGKTNDSDLHSLRENVNVKINALHVLQTLLKLNHSCHYSSEDRNVIMIVDSFQMIFPSCFTVLFKQLHTLLRFTTPLSSPKLAAQIISVLVSLLELTLQPPPAPPSSLSYDNTKIRKALLVTEEDNVTLNNTNNNNHHSKVIEESTKRLMLAVSNINTSSPSYTRSHDKMSNSQSRYAVSSCTNTITNTISSSNNNVYSTFVKNVKQKIPFPLTILFKLIPTHSSNKVRLAGMQLLCKCILVDTWTFWDYDYYLNNVNNCLVTSDGILSSDDDNNVQESAFECLMVMMDDDYQEVSKSCIQIFELFQSKLNFLHVEKKKKIQRRIMTKVLDHIQSLPSILRSTRESDLRTKIKLISGYVSIIRTMNSSLNKTDSDNDENKSAYDYLIRKLMMEPCRQCFADLFSLEDDIQTQTITILSPGQQLKYMSENTAKLAKEMIHKIAHLLGPKHCAIYADECIANIFDSLSSRIQRFDPSLSDKFHFTWIKQYYGTAVIAIELIKGHGLLGALKKRDRNIFLSFTQSVLPVILGDTLWQLPSSFFWASKMKQKNNNHLHHQSMFKHDRNKIISMSSEVKDVALRSNTLYEYDPDIYSASLSGNAMMQFIFIEFIEVLSSILGSNFNEFIPMVIYPLLQKTSDINSTILQKAALDVITKLSLSSGYASVDVMFSAQFRYIVEIISMELGVSLCQSDNQLRQQAVCFYSLHNVIKIMLKSLTSERETMRASIIDETQLIVLVDMMKIVNSWFNTNFKKDVKSLIAFMVVPLSMLQVFRACVEYIDTMIKLGSEDNTDCMTPSDECNWSDLLLQFQCSNETIENQKEDSKPIPVDQDFNSTSLTQERERIGDMSFLSLEILGRLKTTITQMMLTNSVLLSLPELTLQREACDLLKQSFHLLYTIQEHCKQLPENEKSDIGDPLLELVSKYWNPIQSRFHGTVLSFCNKSDHGTARMHLALLLSSLLELISTISKLCDGFFADRFQRNILPDMSKLFECLVFHVKNVEDDPSIKMSKENSIVLTDLLACVDVTFSTNAHQLASLVPVVGLIILPFLALNENLGNVALQTMKTLVKIDSDCLWRALLKTSGMDIPQRPLLPMTNQIEYHVTEKITQTPLSKRSQELIEFVNTLPEQNILF